MVILKRNTSPWREVFQYYVAVTSYEATNWYCDPLKRISVLLRIAKQSSINLACRFLLRLPGTTLYYDFPSYNSILHYCTLILVVLIQSLNFVLQPSPLIYLLVDRNIVRFKSTSYLC